MSERRRARRKVPVPDALWAELLAKPREGLYIFPSEKTDLATLMEILGHTNPRTAKVVH